MDVILISSKKNKRINIRLKTIFIIVGGAAILMLLFLFIYNIVHFTSRKVDEQRLAQLKQENKIVRKEISRIEEEFARLNSVIDSLEQYDRKLRTYASLHPIDEDLRNMGIGGPAPAPEGRLPGDVRSHLTHLSETLDNLVARSRLQKDSFDELLTYIEEKRHLRNHTPSIAPVRGWFISGFGNRIDPFTGQLKMHEGLDIAAPPGTPIVAPADGIVRSVRRSAGFGLILVLDHGYGYRTLYGHCQRIKADVGTRVKRGDIIAYVGNTGKSTGPHLHYEIHVSQKPVNPIHYIISSASPAE